MLAAIDTWLWILAAFSVGMDWASEEWRTAQARKNPRHLVGAWGWVLR
jgi:hypothetical protein